MTTLIIHGLAPSSYTRSALMMCLEKGVEHELRPVDLGSESHRKLHPWGKIPSLEHGSFRCFETTAVCRYIDDVFPGPALTPKDPQARALMEQWISALNCYLYEHMIKNYVLQYIFPRGADGKPNREVIDRAVPLMNQDLDAVENGLSGKSWLAGELSIADVFYGPCLWSAANFPEGKKAIEARP